MTRLVFAIIATLLAVTGDARTGAQHAGRVPLPAMKIERDPTHPERIVTVREVGYKLVAA